MLYALRAVYILCHFVVVCIFALGYCLVHPRALGNTTKMASLMSWALPFAGIHFVAKNQAQAQTHPQAVYVVNHQDVLDVFICSAMLPPNIAILGKSDLRYIPIFGLTFWLAGNLFIDRKNKTKAWDTMAVVARRVKERGCSMYIFPEGTRSHGKGMLPFKSGAFVLAIQSGLPIIPIVFSSTHKNIDLHCWHAGTALGAYLDPIQTQGLTEDDVKSLIETTRNRMIAAQAQLDQEAQVLNQTPKRSLSEQIHKYLKNF